MIMWLFYLIFIRCSFVGIREFGRMCLFSIMRNMLGIFLLLVILREERDFDIRDIGL